MWSKKKQHEWDYLGKAKGGGELGHCDLCNKYRLTKNKISSIISKEKFNELFKGL